MKSIRTRADPRHKWRSSGVRRTLARGPPKHRRSQMVSWKARQPNSRQPVAHEQWPHGAEFEKRLAKHLGVKHCVVMCNGTIALEIAIPCALGLKGEVIVPIVEFRRHRACAVLEQDITPVFADIDPRTHNLDPDAVRRMITPRTTRRASLEYTFGVAPPRSTSCRPSPTSMA